MGLLWMPLIICPLALSCIKLPKHSRLAWEQGKYGHWSLSRCVCTARGAEHPGTGLEIAESN